MKDLVLVATMLVAFAFALTVHVAIVFGLVKRTPRWHALVALVLVPSAPWFAWREHMRTRAGLWIAGVVTYLVALVLAR